MSRTEEYSALVRERKLCRLCEGLANPADAEHEELDSAEIGPWTCWHGDLDADLMIVGQDWGDVGYFRKWKGRDEPSGNPTNENLRKLVRSIGIEIGTPGSPTGPRGVFMTNLILCLKADGLQAPVEKSWLTNCAQTFFTRLVDVVKPRVVVVLGLCPTLAVLGCFGLKVAKNTSMRDLMERGPYPIRKGALLFPVYHCGAGGVNRNRSLPEQVKDWAPIGNALQRADDDVVGI